MWDWLAEILNKITPANVWMAILWLWQSAEFMTALVMVITVSLLTESAKRVLIPAKLPKAQMARTIYAWSLFSGLLVTMITWLATPTPLDIRFWLVMAIATGPIANGLYKYTMPIIMRLVDRFLPGLSRRSAQREIK